MRPPAPKPSVSVEKAGWKANGNSGGGHTAHDGKFKKSEGGKKVVYAPGALPAKKSLSDLP